MRVTNSTILRGYNRNLNRLQTAQTASQNKILSGRSFSRASENPLSASKALKVRKSLYDTAQYQENLETANSLYTEAETSLLQVSEQLTTIRETLIAAVNSTNDSTSLNIYAQQLQTMAEELVSILNTDSAGRVIFGGESNSSMPFTIDSDSGTVLYQGVPVNAYDDYTYFPYSDDIYIDIGLGLQIDEETRQVNPQSGLKISFNGADVSGCGTENGTADIDLTQITENKSYSLIVYAGNEKQVVDFKGGASQDETVANIQAALDEAYKNSDVSPTIDEFGIISVDDGTVQIMNNTNASTRTGTVTFENVSGYSSNYQVDCSSLTSGTTYALVVTVDDVSKTVQFTATGNEDEDKALLQSAIDEAFDGTDYSPTLCDDGVIRQEGSTVKLASSALASEDGSTIESLSLSRQTTYSNNYIQLTLDAAKALQNGDIEYANACIDRIVSASENVLVEIAEMGCNEEFIEFSLNRLDTRELNLSERQESLEATDLEEEITIWKTYEALYNAALQMSSSIVPNSIFNYIS